MIQITVPFILQPICMKGVNVSSGSNGHYNKTFNFSSVGSYSVANYFLMLDLISYFLVRQRYEFQKCTYEINQMK